MSLAKKIARLTLVQVATRIISVGFGVYLVYAVLHYLDVANFGRYSLVINIIQIAVTLTDFGLYLVASKEISNVKGDPQKQFSSVFTFRILSALFFFLLLNLATAFFPYDRTVKIGIYLTSILFLSLSLNQVLMSVFQKAHETSKFAFIELFSKFFMVLLTQIFINLGFGIYYLLQAISIATLVQALLLLFFAHKYIPFKLELDFASLKKVFSQSWPLALSVIFTTVFFRGESLALSWLKPVEDVGIYNAAFRILETLAGFPVLFVGLVLPYLAGTFSEENIQGFRYYFRRAFDGVFALTLPLVTAFIVLAKPILNFIAGAQYSESVYILQILMLAVGVIYLAALPAHAVTIIGKQKFMMYFYFAAAVAASLSYILLIPRFGYSSLPWIVLASQSIVFLCSQIIIGVKTGAWPRISTFAKCLIASVLMAVVMREFTGYNFLLAAGIGGVVYLALVFILRVLDLKEWRGGRAVEGAALEKQ